MRRLVALLAGLLLLLPGCSGEEEGTEVYSGMSLTEVIHTLESGGSTERQRAAATLGWMGTAPGAREALYRGEDAGGAPGPTASTPHAVRALVAALEDPVPLVRLQVARSLRLLWPHAAEAAPALAGRLEDEDPEVRFEAAFALAEMTEELDAAWPVLLEALVDESKPVLASRVLEDLHTGKERRADAAVRILGLNDELGARLAGVIADDARIPELRRRAIEAAVVSRPGRADERLAEALVTALADMDESVAAAAAAALASRPETLRIALPRLLALSRQGEPAARARGLDAVRIAAPGPEDALEPALAALDHEDRRVRLAPGIYFLNSRTGGEEHSLKVVVLR